MTSDAHERTEVEATGEGGTGRPDVMWSPTARQVRDARMTDFVRHVRRTRGVELEGYRDLWRWSVTELSDFWSAVGEHSGILGDGLTGPALAVERMPGAVWYPEARINYAENVLRWVDAPGRADEVAILHLTEDGTTTPLTWADFATRVALLARWLRARGIGRGDAVAAVLPNVPEAIIGLLASAAVGATWSIASPDLAPSAVVARAAQLEPAVLLGSDGYRWNGDELPRVDHLREVLAGLPTVRETVLFRSLDTGAPVPEGWVDGDALLAAPAGAGLRPQFDRVPFGHPLWVLFSSGTTGAPKGIVHGHGGMVLEAAKGIGLALDLGPGDRYYVAASTSWMVWNTLANTLLVGAGVVTYDGSPTAGRVDRQLEILSRTRATFFGVGAAYLTLVEKAGHRPAEEHDLTALRGILSTGSPLPAHTWRWAQEQLGPDVHLGSDSGGTDICSGFVGSNPLEPVHLGELQGPLLGVAAEAWDDAGRRVVGEVGELVVTRPMPSMPLFLWGDEDGSRYASSYFATFPGTWRQGDWITETPRGGIVVHGRSDATLNRGGVRIGSAEIYAAVDDLPRVRDSLVVGVEEEDAGYYLPLFVVLADGEVLDEQLRDEIREAIRERASARHIPDEILQAPAIPRNVAGKRLEVPVKRLYMGASPGSVDTSVLTDPTALDWFVRAAGRRLSR